MYKIILLFNFFLFSQFDYNLPDLNTDSDFYQQSIGTSYFENKVTIHYFGHFN